MTSAEIRQSFLDFFKSKQHTIVPSSSLLPEAPNLLFTNAGMNQFVPIFLGQQKPDVSKWPGAVSGLDTRAADTQKCIRAGGKHNDLEDVGLDTYHHTFFEMLGNWSFGDYFKKEAIEWAWELLTQRWNFKPERLYATVYCPYKDEDLAKWKDELETALGLAKNRIAGSSVSFDGTETAAITRPDREAACNWAEQFLRAGLAEDEVRLHIIPGSRKDNFWMMGETGPCGPCSEIHIDLTPDGDTQGKLVNQGDARCIEIWNLVFIQFNANPDGTISPLPARHVDTGMGFERVTGIIQNTKNFTDFSGAISNYETDIFHPIFDKLEELSGKKYGSTLPDAASVSGAGSAGVPPASGGVSPTELATEGGARVSRPHPSGSSPGDSVARDAQQSDRDGRAPQASYYKRRLPQFERPWAKYMVSVSTHDRRPLSDKARDVVLKSLLFGQEQRRYQLYAACVMPDHLHFLFEPQIKEQDKEGKPVFWPLTDLLHSIKSFTAHEINKLEGTSGRVWENESFDRMIRGDADLEEKFHYICRNPWESGVVPPTENYPWLWTPDAESGAQGAAGVTSAASNMPLTASSESPERGGRGSHSQASASTRTKSAARDAQQSDRDGRAPHSPEQIQLDVAFRVIADHIRALSFAIADGIQPGNTDRSYVLRRILRRAVRYGRKLDFHEPFFYKLVDVLAETMGDFFPEIREKKEHVKEVIRLEEEAFNKTLDRGILLFKVALDDARIAAGAYSEADLTKGVELQSVKVQRGSDGVIRKELTGSFAFKLYDEQGFPLDLTQLMAKEYGLSVDVAVFNRRMEEQRARAAAGQRQTVITVQEGMDLVAATKFVGYENTRIPSRVLTVIPQEKRWGVVLSESPFYADMGGQVGDTGLISLGASRWRVIDTKKVHSTWLHIIEADEPPAIGPVDFVEVDVARRNAIQRHHTVTHLLHWALHEVASKEASQKGSYVGPEKLTFDFNCAPLTPQQVADIEKLVNERILENAGVSWTEVPYAEVKSRKDVMQFFGDKYGDKVRVVQIGGRAGELDGYSMELCGGTHTRATGEIGLFRIVGEGAIAAGVRRIEAVAGLEAYRKATEELRLLESLAGKVNSPVGELEKKIEAILAQQKGLEKQLRAAQQREASNIAGHLKAQAAAINGIPAIIHNLGAADGDFLQSVADVLKGNFKGVIVLGGLANNAVSLVAAVSPDCTTKVQAGKIIQVIAPIVGGKGGGKADNARGGGKEAARLDEALVKAAEFLKAT